MEKKFTGFRECRLGYSKHNFFFFPYSIVKPYCSNFRIITVTAMFSVVRRFQIFTIRVTSNELPRDKTNKIICVPSKDSVSDQPGHLPNLIRVFAVLSMGS